VEKLSIELELPDRLTLTPIYPQALLPIRKSFPSGESIAVCSSPHATYFILKSKDASTGAI
jgi:hypothetical protein